MEVSMGKSPVYGGFKWESQLSMGEFDIFDWKTKYQCGIVHCHRGAFNLSTVFLQATFLSIIDGAEKSAGQNPCETTNH